MTKTVVADAGYGNEENYLYAIGEEKEQRFDYLIPYNTYLKEKTSAYRNDIKNAKNWTYLAHDLFNCPNGRKVIFQSYKNKKNALGHVQI